MGVRCCGVAGSGWGVVVVACRGVWSVVLLCVVVASGAVHTGVVVCWWGGSSDGSDVG